MIYLSSWYNIHKTVHKDITCLTENYCPIRFLTLNEEDSYVFLNLILNTKFYVIPTTPYLKAKTTKRTNKSEFLIKNKILRKYSWLMKVIWWKFYREASYWCFPTVSFAYSADKNIMELRINRLGFLKNNKFSKTYMQVQ